MLFDAILNREPVPATQVNAAVPPELGRIIGKALEKDRDVRYQWAREMLADLKRLKRDTASGRTSAASSSPSVIATAVSQTPVVPRRMGRAVWIAIASVAALGVVAFTAWLAAAPPPARVTASTQITTDGVQKGYPVTDGSRLYFTVSRLRGRNSAASALAQVAASGGETVELASVAPAVLDIDPRGAELLVADRISTSSSSLAVMPVLGGAVRRLGNLTANPAIYGITAAWSPDASHVVYTTGSDVRVARADGSEPRTLLTASGVTFAPRWSPDGARIRYSVRDARTGAFALWEANADGSNPNALLPGWTGAQNPAAASGPETANTSSSRRQATSGHCPKNAAFFTRDRASPCSSPSDQRCFPA